MPLLGVAIYGIALYLFIFAVWFKWYPVLQNKLNPTLFTWTFKVGLNGLAGLGGYLNAHYYLNYLTGVDPNNFPKTLLVFTVPFAMHIWLLFIAVAAGLVLLGYLLWVVAVGAWNVFVVISKLIVFPFIVPVFCLVQVCKFLLCIFHEFLMSAPNYANCRERFLASLDEGPLPGRDQPPWIQEKTIRGRHLFTYLLGPLALLACIALLEGLSEYPPMSRVIYHVATTVLVFADFSHDKTCSVSNPTHWVAPLKDRKEQDSPKVLIADLSKLPDIRFSVGACK